jgi:hypothetical protein
MLQVTKSPLFKINWQYICRDFNIVTLYVPILFAYQNEENNYYLVFLIDFFEGLNLVVLISAQNLIQLLSGEIKLREPIEMAQTVYYVKDGRYITDDIVIEMTLSEVPEEYLPAKDSYLETYLIENSEEYIQKLKRMLEN